VNVGVDLDAAALSKVLTPIVLSERAETA